MTKKEIQELGFNKEIVYPDDSGMSNSYHYYTYDVIEGVNLITPANDKIIDDSWYVVVFMNTPNIRFKNAHELQTLIEILNQNKEDE
tara:strand:+ start:11425 stop:11685 length:261 start_codon:yes stop_codon:yes gene_type:complete